MKEIECPACGELIPDDSKYCDMCGVELLQCVNCGALGTDRFCSECGKPMVARSGATNTISTPSQPKNNDVHSTAGVRKPSEPAKVDGHTTAGVRARKSIALKSRRGQIILRPQADAIIGRSEGPYAEQLNSLQHISRRHGQFLKQGRDWYIVDLGSTNGTLVNDIELEPDSPMKLTIGDLVDIGTYLFNVVEL